MSIAPTRNPSGKIPVVWSASTRFHEPKTEVWVGQPSTGTEVPERVDAILSALVDHPLVRAVSHPDRILRQVHDPELLTFLETAHPRWLKGPHVDRVGQDRVVPYFFPTPALTQGMPSHRAVAIHGDAGRFGYDTMTLIGPGTWQAARAAVDCALTAVDLVMARERAAYALCRPPGHHVTRSGYGGSCYLNNAAVAAEALRAGGHERVAVLDLDAHHGNGTQAIFWERSDVLYASVHVDPGAGWFPHIFGYADEQGAGAGSGKTKNLPLPEATEDGRWVASVSDLVDWIGSAQCSAVVVSLGVDAASEDPESPLLVTTDGYRGAGSLVAALKVPSVIVQEGGYHLPSMGGFVAAYLGGHSSPV